MSVLAIRLLEIVYSTGGCMSGIVVVRYFVYLLPARKCIASSSLVDRPPLQF